MDSNWFIQYVISFVRHITYKKLGNQMTDSWLWLDILSCCFSSLSLSLPVMMWWWEPECRQRVPVHIPKTPAAPTTYCSSACWLAAGDITGEQNKPWKVWLHCLHGWEQQAVNKLLSLLSPPDLLPFTMKDTRDQDSQTTWALREKGCQFTTERTRAFSASKIDVIGMFFYKNFFW